MTSNDITVSSTGEGASYWTGYENVVRLSGDDTDGAFTVLEIRVPPGAVNPPHINHDEDQTDHVVSGELVVTVDGEDIRATEGTIIHIPAGVPHAFRNDGEEEAVVIDWLHPAGLEELMERVAPRVEDPTDPPDLDMERVLEVAPEYGVEFLDVPAEGPPTE